MAKRRGSGEGSIYTTKDGRWRGEISLGYKPDGKPRRKVLYGRTRVDVAEEMKRVLREQQLGIEVKPERQTVASLLRSWLESSVKQKNRAQTLRSYSWIVETHLVPGLGKVTVDKLTPQRVQAFLIERKDSGLSSGTVKHIRATLRAALTRAEKWGVVHRNVAKLVTVPAGDRYKPTVLAPDQAREFLKFAAAHKNGALLVTAITLGLRRGELLALRWRDIDLDGSSLRVTHSLERIKGKGLELCEPKSERAKRQLRLPPVTTQALQEHRAQQAIARQWAGSAWKEGDFVFTSSIGTPLMPEVVNRELASVLKAASLPKIRTHDLRHSCATLLLSMKVHPKLVQETLGHSSFQLTMDTYSHILPALRNEVADRMNEVFAPTPTKSPTNTSGMAVQ